MSCARELVEKRGAQPDVPAAATTTRGRTDRGITPLCIAAARGMPSVVKFLLKFGASSNLEGTGRFRLYSNQKLSVSGTFSPLGFALAMREKEVEEGATEMDLGSLDKCIQLLMKAEKNMGRKVGVSTSYL